MNDINFFSSNTYIFLPTKKNPKVALCVDNYKLAYNAFKLYNPFSKKAKIYKRVVFLFVVVFHFLIRRWKQEKKSDIVKYLENKLDTNLCVSVYFATAKDKVVLQLQTQDAKIIGYVKFPVSLIGIQRINNEINAINILSEKKIIPKLLNVYDYNQKPLLLLTELDGNIGIVSEKFIYDLVHKLKRERTYTFENHPRILSIKQKLVELNMPEELNTINALCTKLSNKKFALVYEHGDFAPWNIVQIQNEYIPFDWEYFVEDGLEYFDLIKYYYQIGNLLESKDADELKTYVCHKIDIANIDDIYDIFIIKESILEKLEML